jgi:hypothetical protein
MLLIDEDNRWSGYPDYPLAEHVDARMQQQLASAFAALPQRVRTWVNKHLLEVCPISHLGTSGYMKVLRDGHGEPVGAFIAVDVGRLDTDANEWMTEKERSPFRDAPEVSLDAVIENPPWNVRANALQYLLLHELGHLLAVSNGILPEANTMAPEKETDFPFASIGWEAGRGPLSARDGEYFPNGRAPSYYALPARQQPAAGAEMYYDALSRTGFPTLYAATNVDEDFAESFANYVHVVVMKRPWRITLRHAGSPDRVIEACWNERRCSSRRRFFDGLWDTLGMPSR